MQLLASRQLQYSTVQYQDIRISGSGKLYDKDKRHLLSLRHGDRFTLRAHVQVIGIQYTITKYGYELLEPQAATNAHS